MYTRFKLLFVLVVSLLIIPAQTTLAQNYNKISSESFQKFLDSAPPRFKNMFMPLHLPQNYSSKSLAGYSIEDWQLAIDTTWGPGMSLSNRIMFFDSTWYLIDYAFPAFNGLDPDYWQDFYDQHSPDIYNPGVTISRGKFFADLQYGFMGLGDDHTALTDCDICLTAPAPGIPILQCASIGNNDHFGAGLTPLPDSTLLVYLASASHPLGLVAGDMVLGYDGELWKDIYPQLLSEQIPMNQPPYHTTEKTFLHSILSSAGLNWHLFDTIDVVKYATGDTVHLPTSLMVGHDLECWATEQLEIPGVPKPNPYLEQLFTWGYVDGTEIAYIYTHGWWGNEFELRALWGAALDSIRYNGDLEGLIIDDRTNWGTAHLSFTDVMFRMFDTTIETFRWHRRCSIEDHFAMCDCPELSSFINSIDGEAEHFFNCPMAILTGPHAVSGGDLFPLTMTFHPMTKIFGKPTCGAFSTVTAGEWIYPDWVINLTYAPCDLVDDPGDYILRKEFPNAIDFPWVDYEEVWLTKDGVAQGRDDVVEAAIEWILNGDKDLDGVINASDNCPGTVNPGQADLDGDGIGDSCDLCSGYDDYSDDDADDFPYCFDNCPDTSNADQLDYDDDGVGNACDNCWVDYNSDQSDADNDGVGDICDVCTDTDNDGAGNPGYEANNCVTDNCSDVFNPMQDDTDEDGIGDACDFICGDANNDDQVNIGDAVFLINYIFNGGSAPIYPEAGDVNCDFTTNIGDAVYLISYIFRGGDSPCAGCL